MLAEFVDIMYNELALSQRALRAAARVFSACRDAHTSCCVFFEFPHSLVAVAVDGLLFACHNLTEAACARRDAGRGACTDRVA